MLSDGGTVHVRPIRPDDAGRLVAFHAALSPETVYYRFFSPRPRLSEADVTRFTTVDHVDRMALIALLGDEMIAVARYDRHGASDEAEVAFTVSDRHQGRGISTLLLEHLSVVAREHGITTFTAQVLPDNRKMLAVFRSVGFAVRNAFDSGIIDVTLDLNPSAETLARIENRERRAEARSVARFLSPRSVAVIGASPDPSAFSHQIFRALVRSGFPGPVYPVHPSATVVASVRTTATVAEIPDDVDLAVVAVRGPQVHDAVRDCIAKGVRAVVVVSGDVPDPAGLRDLARGNGIRLIGPASMGLVVPRSGLQAAWFDTTVPAGPVGISSQSGPLGRALLAALVEQGMGVSTFVSLGDRVDVSGNDLLQYWEDDPHTRVCLLYTETFGNPRKFSRLARRLSRTKPIVAVKAPEPDDAAIDALYQQAGVIRVGSVPEQLDVARVLVGQPLPPGNRVLVVTNARSPAVLAVRALAGAGLVPARLGVDTRTELDAVLPEGATVDGVVDLTHRARPADYRNAVEAVLADPGVDALVVVCAPPRLDELDTVLGTVADLARDGTHTVVCVGLGQRDALVGDLPVFTYPERAVAALGRVTRYAAWRTRPAGEHHELDADAAASASAIVDAALVARPGGTLLPVRHAVSLLRSAGVTAAETRAVLTAEAAVVAADEIGYPVALKAAPLPRSGRDERAGVALDLPSSEAVAGAYARMSTTLGPAMCEAVVQPMVPGGVECIVEVTQHPDVGPVVGVGIGGVFADDIGDRCSVALPVTDADARRLLDGSRAARAIARIGGDGDALVALVLRLGALVERDARIDRVRLNPVLVSAHGAWAVDVEVQVRPTPDAPVIPLRRLG